MTASINRQGEIVLRARQDTTLKVNSGDIFVATRERSGRVVLKRAVQKGEAPGNSFLTPPPLPRGTLTRIYAKHSPASDKIGEEAVAAGRRALVGKRLQD